MCNFAAKLDGVQFGIIDAKFSKMLCGTVTEASDMNSSTRPRGCETVFTNISSSSPNSRLSSILSSPNPGAQCPEYPSVRCGVVGALCPSAHRRVLERRAPPAAITANQGERLELFDGVLILSCHRNSPSGTLCSPGLFGTR